MRGGRGRGNGRGGGRGRVNGRGGGRGRGSGRGGGRTGEAHPVNSLSAYEIQRLENIKSNQAEMARLGIGQGEQGGAKGGRGKKRKRSSGSSSSREEEEEEEEELEEEEDEEVEDEEDEEEEERRGLDQRSDLEKRLEELCSGGGSNMDWSWPSFSGNEFGTVKTVTTQDMILTIYATKKDDKISTVASAQGVDADKMMDLTLYFNEAIFELEHSSIFTRNTLLVIDMKEISSD